MHQHTVRHVTRMVTSGGLVFGVLAAVAGLSAALFTSGPVIAQDNEFTTGSVDLSIASNVPDPTLGDQPGTYSTTIPGADALGMLPGDSETFQFWLKNESPNSIELDLSGDITNLTFADTAGNPINIADTDLDSTMEVTFSCDVQDGSADRDGSSPTNSLADWDAVGPESLDQGAGSTPGRLGAADAADGSGADEALCTMTTTLQTASTAASTTAVFDAEFTGSQI